MVINPSAAMGAFSLSAAVASMRWNVDHSKR
jgi:hypothetical protein